MANINIIAAIGKNRELGKDNQLLWRLPEDLKRFKAITTGHPVIMGRKTYESIPRKFRPLPDRTNIVLTRNLSWTEDGAIGVHSLEAALAIAEQSIEADEIFIIGGASIYEQAIEEASKLYLTLVDDSSDADVFFPTFADFGKETFTEEHETENGLKYTFVIIER